MIIRQSTDVRLARRHCHISRRRLPSLSLRAAAAAMARRRHAARSAIAAELTAQERALGDIRAAI